MDNLEGWGKVEWGLGGGEGMCGVMWEVRRACVMGSEGWGGHVWSGVGVGRALWSGVGGGESMCGGGVRGGRVCGVE